jgi:hypothetical protein
LKPTPTQARVRTLGEAYQKLAEDVRAVLTLGRLLRGSLAAVGGPWANQAGGGATEPSSLIGRGMRVAVVR